MSEAPVTLRLFVAVELGAEVLRALNELQHQLTRRGLQPLRWVRPEGIHLTLQFLGEIDSRRVAGIEQAIRRAVAGVPPHVVRLDRLGSFGSRMSPRVLWVGLSGDVDTLGRLQERMERELAAAGFPPEGRRFSAHLTLARVRPETAREVARPLAAAVESTPVPQAEVHVSEVSLMRSMLGPGGAAYTRLFAAPLS